MKKGTAVEVTGRYCKMIGAVVSVSKTEPTITVETKVMDGHPIVETVVAHKSTVRELSGLEMMFIDCLN